ncbi:MAG: hypothetical protein KC417_16050, partial [Myxococcales bacterium]|nr:hypothetical protein [Myxococcales bacterium]
MRSKSTTLGVGLAVLAVAVVANVPGDAQACGGAPCQEGWLLPADGGTVPANAVAFPWRLDVDRTVSEQTVPSVDDDVVFVKVEGETKTPLGVSLVAINASLFRIVPEAPLEEGATYELRVTDFCGQHAGVAARSATFSVGPEASVPTDLGTVVANEPVRETVSVLTNDAACMADADAVTRGLALDPSEDVAPWISLLAIEKKIDIRVWASATPDPTTSVYALCEPPPPTAGTVGLAVGEHDAEFTAWLYGAESDADVQLHTAVEAFDL